jgi:uncharacterized membrane protein
MSVHVSQGGKTSRPAAAGRPGTGPGATGPPGAAGPPVAGLDRRALAAVSVTVLAWSSAFVAIREAGRYFDPGALMVVYLGMVPTALAFTTWAYALTRTTAGKMGATTYVVPAIVVLMSWAFLGETPRPLAYLGGALCLAGVAVSRGRARRAVTPAVEPEATEPAIGQRTAGDPVSG